MDDRSDRQKILDAGASLREALDLLDSPHGANPSVPEALESIDDAAYSLGRPNRQPFYLYRLMLAREALDEWLRPGPSLGEPGGPEAALRQREALVRLKGVLGCGPSCKVGCVCGWHEIECAWDSLPVGVSLGDEQAGH